MVVQNITFDSFAPGTMFAFIHWWLVAKWSMSKAFGVLMGSYIESMHIHGKSHYFPCKIDIALYIFVLPYAMEITCTVFL